MISFKKWLSENINPEHIMDKQNVLDDLSWDAWADMLEESGEEVNASIIRSGKLLKNNCLKLLSPIASNDIVVIDATYERRQKNADVYARHFIILANEAEIPFRQYVFKHICFAAMYQFSSTLLSFARMLPDGVVDLAETVKYEADQRNVVNVRGGFFDQQISIIEDYLEDLNSIEFGELWGALAGFSSIMITSSEVLNG